MRRPLPAAQPGVSAVNSIPAVIVILVLAIAAIELVLSLADLRLIGGQGSIGWRIGLIERLSVSPIVLDILRERGGRDIGLASRFLSYPFVHQGALHALFGGAMLLALGKFVAEGMGSLAALAVLVVSTVLGGLAFALGASEAQPLFGVYPAVYGLIGAFTYLMWLRLGQAGENRLRAFRLIGLLLAVQLAFGALFGTGPGWIADLGGFVAGFGTAILAAPGGLAALRARLRTR